AVSERGKITVRKAYGTANLETDTPVTTSSVFELASVTKQFTAAAIMLLVEEGKVRLDDAISIYISNTPESWKNITVRHLLSHTGGLRLGAVVFLDEQGNLTGNGGAPLLNISTERAFKVIAGAPLNSPPGEHCAYSDAGYFLLGMIIEKAGGKPYGEFMQKRIFDSLQMSDSSVIDKRRIVRNHVSVYGISDGELSNWRRDFQHQLPSFYGVLSTLDDLIKWDRALRNATLLKRSSLDQMWTPAKLSNGSDAILPGEFPYGFGW